MNKKITIDFKNIIEEMKDKKLNICFLSNRGIFMEDLEKNLYTMEGKAYLDNLIKNHVKVEFTLSENSKENIEEWEREIWKSEDVKDFIDRQSKYWI